MTRLLVTAAALLVLLSARGQAAEPAATRGMQTLTVRGRTVEVYVPERHAPRAPLLVAFHWSTARGRDMLRLWKDTADAEGIILMLPSSRHRRTWTHEDGLAVDDALRQVLATNSVDRSRIYLTGFSGGANFAYRFFVTHPRLFAGLGPFAGRLNATEAELDAVAATSLKRACIVHGTIDRKIPFSEARRAVRALSQRGLDVQLTPLQQGHWPHAGYAAPMWKCLDGDSNDRRS